ncbi:MAG: glycosyltransferase [Candidatus Heimdallarchaeota archaeon]|nr:MAG: glycosyltransferase [Candidatus Heimdallarchaeota archaeon]
MVFRSNPTILFLTDVVAPSYGGLATSSYRIINYLAEIYNVVVLTPQQKVSPIQEKPQWPSSVKIVTFKRPESEARYLENYSSKGEQLCQEVNFCLIIGFYLYRAGFVATYLGQRFQIPVLLSARGNDIHRCLLHPDRHSFILYALKNCSLFTAVSEELVQKARAFAPALINRSFIVGNGIMIKEIAVRPKRGVEGEKSPRFTLGFAGDNRKKKGFHVLLQALHLIPSEFHSRIEVKIAGFFDEEELKNLIAPLKAYFPIHYLGCLRQEEMSSFYKSLDLLVVPSLHDGLPNILLEGIASGIGVVGSRTGGISEVLKNFPELLFRPGDSQELAFLLTNLLQGVWDTSKFIEPLRDYCREHYSEEVEKQKWVKAIKRASEC